MINSRRIEDLHPKVQPLVRAFEAHADEVLKPQGIDLLITSTYRDHASQQALFDQGRTKPGKIVTNARPGQSFHNRTILPMIQAVSAANKVAAIW